MLAAFQANAEQVRAGNNGTRRRIIVPSAESSVRRQPRISIHDRQLRAARRPMNRARLSSSSRLGWCRVASRIRRAPDRTASQQTALRGGLCREGSPSRADRDPRLHRARWSLRSLEAELVASGPPARGAALLDLEWLVTPEDAGCAQLQFSNDAIVDSNRAPEPGLVRVGDVGLTAARRHLE